MRNIKFISVLIVILFSFHAVLVYGFYPMSDDTGYRDSLSPKNTSYYKYYVSSDRMAVLTLKNMSYESDFDIYVYSDESMTNLIGKGANDEDKTELELISQKDYGRYVYIKVINYGDSYATYKLYAHEVDFIQILTDALVESAVIGIIKLLLSDEDDTESETRNKSRAATAIFGALSGKNLGEIGKDLLISEVTSSLREELGYGFWGDYAVSCGVSFIRKIYKYY
jgi:hypothetical protein